MCNLLILRLLFYFVISLRCGCSRCIFQFIIFINLIWQTDRLNLAIGVACAQLRDSSRIASTTRDDVLEVSQKVASCLELALLVLLKILKLFDVP